jgi:NAD(P)-dependent dehydrogenase (short-subunit alcohol dehydrogenase family)
MARFANKVAVITGGNSGIGLAAAYQFKKEGAAVVISGRDQRTLSEAGSALGKDALAVQADVTVMGDLDRLFAAIKQRFGRIDVLFANAGVAKLSPFESTPESLFDEMVNTNLRGAFFTAQKALPLLTKGGAVIFNTTFFGHIGVAGTSAYSASKAAVRSLTRTLATELLPLGVRVNAVSPGPISTPIYGKLGLPSETVEQIGKAIQEQIPLKRFGMPEEIATAVAFLASDDSSYMTGCELAVDGGRTQL